MSFVWSEKHIEEYWHHGVTVFRGILPPSLLTDLRTMAEKGRAITRAKHGPQAQRLQPISGHEGYDVSAFDDFLTHPPLVDALKKVLSPRHEPSAASHTGIFYEPANEPWCTGWHRDITAQSAGVDAQEFALLERDPTFFTQVNCALYTDVSTWYVPGSDGRPNLDAEVEAAKHQPDLEGKSSAERERLCLAYCQSMPNAVQLVLEAGDYALYRPNGWHIGSYAPYRRRETIHTGVWKPETAAWYVKWYKNLAAERAKASA